MRTISTLLFLCLVQELSLAQPTGIGIGTATPSSSAILDVQSSNRGALMPRMTTAQRKAIAAPEPGLIVYDTDKRTIFIFEGTRWGQLVYEDDEQTGPLSRTATDGQAGDQLGASVAIDGDNAIAGSPYANVGVNPDQGAAYIFSKVNGTWLQTAKLVASDGTPNDRFGYAVSISGNYAIVGAYQKNGSGGGQQGAAYVYVKNNGLWTQQAKLTAADATANDHFGYSVGIKGDNIIVGAPDDDVSANTDQGSVYFFTRNGTVWPQETRLSPGSAANMHTGLSVCMDNVYAIAGSPGNKAAYFFIKLINPWSFYGGVTNAANGFGRSVSMSGDYAVVGAPYNNFSTGIAYVYKKGAFGIWVEDTLLNALMTQGTLYFGATVSISGNNITIGAPGYVENNVVIGEVYRFSRSGSLWSFIGRISDVKSENEGLFGGGISISGYNIIVSSPGAEAGKGEIHFLNIE